MAVPEVTDHVSIADAMDSLRQQVLEASVLAQNNSLRFTVREIEVEFQVALTTELQGTAQVSIWSVLTLGGGASRSSERTHRVRLVLEPHRSTTPAPTTGTVQLEDSDE